jgi:hypothetical protein
MKPEIDDADLVTGETGIETVVNDTGDLVWGCPADREVGRMRTHTVSSSAWECSVASGPTSCQVIGRTHTVARAACSPIRT